MKNKKEQLWAIICFDYWVGCTSAPEDAIEEDSDLTFIKITDDEWDKWKNDKFCYNDIKDRPLYYAEIENKIKMKKV